MSPSGTLKSGSHVWPLGHAEAALPLANWLRSLVDGPAVPDARAMLQTDPVIDAVLELFDALALHWDRVPAARWLSQTAGQVAQQLLATAAWDPQLDERCELAMAARHSRLSWLASPHRRHAFDAGDTVSVYFISRLATAARLFGRTIPPRNGTDPIARPGIQWSLA